MNRLAPLFRSLLKSLLWLAAFLVTLFVIFIVGALAFDPFSGNHLILGRLLFGFVPFLKSNFAAISWNAGTWGPGLGAFVIALLVVHRYLSGWAKRAGREWSFLTTFCLMMIVPVLFVISFIVPGVLLQWEALQEIVWIDIR